MPRAAEPRNYTSPPPGQPRRRHKLAEHKLAQHKLARTMIPGWHDERPGAMSGEYAHCDADGRQDQHQVVWQGARDAKVVLIEARCRRLPGKERGYGGIFRKHRTGNGLFVRRRPNMEPSVEGSMFG
jgi:hypothetical protein